VLTPRPEAFILYLMWGYAEGDTKVVAIVVIIVVIAALAYVTRGLWRKGR
jgi:predicted RND superfamily exporter protein